MLDQLKPEWQDAPDWAGYMVQEPDGKWWWFENEPSFINSKWVSKIGRYSVAYYQYRRTLEKRPTA